MPTRTRNNDNQFQKEKNEVISKREVGIISASKNLLYLSKIFENKYVKDEKI